MNIMSYPYYKGIVTYKGVEYEGTHEPLIDAETWQMCQSILASRINGERSLKHPHFLKSSVYCAKCGSRMMVSNEKKKNGMVYPYFVCAGRHSKRIKDCTTKAVLISAVERQIEDIYKSIQFPEELRDEVQEYLSEIIKKEKSKYDTELNGLKGQKEKLENKRRKLLEAHYSDAIPLDLMKSEQTKIAKQLASIEHEIKAHDKTFQDITKNLYYVMELIQDCGVTYINAPDTVKRLMNQAIFEKFLVANGENEELGIEVELKPPYNVIVQPISYELSMINKSSNFSSLRKYIEKAMNRIHHFFECDFFDAGSSKFPKGGLNSINSEYDAAGETKKLAPAEADANFLLKIPSNMSTTQNFLSPILDQSSSKVLLVEARRIELLSENPSIRLSTSVFCQLKFPNEAADKQAESIGSPNTTQRHGHSPETFTTNRRPNNSRGTLLMDGSRLKLLPVNYF